MSQSSHSSSSDSQLVNAIVMSIKSRGIFDDFRRQCLSDADTKPSFQNLLQRVEGYVSKFLSQQKWNQNINKNQLRERLRTQLNESGMLKYGIEHLVEQVVSYKINSLFWPKIESVVKEFLGISEMPVNDKSSNEKILSNPSPPKTVVKNSIKSEEKQENSELKPIVVKVEPQEDTSLPMDIETDSNCSLDTKNKGIKKEDTMSAPDSDNEEYTDWPTPPQPEMLTPERQQLSYSPIESNKSNEDSNVSVIKKENIYEIDIKQNESFLINNQIMNELNEQKCETTQQKCTTDDIKEKNQTEVKDEELSDVSSVHTSDLSDFDDEISLDDSNDEREDNKKKKISLKVVKKITEVLSIEQNSDSMKAESKPIKEKVSEVSEVSNIETEVKSETKRVRKVNPKYSSEEFSSMFTERDRSIQSTSKDNFEDLEQTKTQKLDEQKLNSRRRRHSNASDDNKESIDSIHNRSSKIAKRKDDSLIDSRSSSRGSIESSLSETTQDSTQSQTRSQKRKINKNRNESQTQRYESSDLYKPRPLISSRRSRAPTTPDSNIE